MQVLKFGGTVLVGAEKVRRAVDLCLAEAAKIPSVAVIAAIGGVTDDLLELGTESAAGRRGTARAIMERLRGRHMEAFCGRAAGTAAGGLIRFLDGNLREIEELAHGVFLLRELGERSRDRLLSYGEVIAAGLFFRLAAAESSNFRYADGRDLIVLDRTSAALVDFAETRRRIGRRLLPRLRRSLSFVVPGFICVDSEGHPATLGRHGSDYTASIIGAALLAREIRIFTELDGIMTADPRLVAEASVLPQVSYQEAAEMSFFSAQVLHPRTMAPAVRHSIPIRMQNVLRPGAGGTLITRRSARLPRVKIVTSMRDLTLVTLQGAGMIVAGVTSRVLETLAREGISIIMLSQASSERSVSLIVQREDAAAVSRFLHREFGAEIERGHLEQVQKVSGVAVVSIIGTGMRGSPGIAGRFFDALGKCRINVLAIAQGSSELNISAAIHEKDNRHAVQAIHSAFGLTRDLNVALFGCGNIGRTLIHEICRNSKQIAKKLEVNVNVLSVVTTRHWWFSAAGFSPSELRAIAGGTPEGTPAPAQARPADEEILERIGKTYKSDVVLVDVTGADLIGTHLRGLRRGFHVVTANKRPLASRLADYRSIQSICRRKGLNYLYETTFGAGLPLLSTLQDLLHTGDRILGIEGCLSGTLGFICSRLDEGLPFSRAVAEAVRLGYSEPDPRDDLSGADVGRKALIIARAIGSPVEFEDIRLRPMIPARLAGDTSIAELLAGSRRIDGWVRRRVAAAHRKGCVLRYIARITEVGCDVGLREVDRDTPIGRLNGPDNILVFRTGRYDTNPLVIQGPGAGANVTAAGVLGDLLKIAKWIR